MTTEEAAYDAALAPFLTGLASNDVAVARRIVRRALFSQWSFGVEARRRLWPDLARRLLTAEKDGAHKLDLPPHNRKTLEGLAAKAPPPSAGVR